MDSCKIYLAGGMSGLTLEEQTDWRRRFCDAIKYGDYDYEKTVSFFDPTQYYSLSDPTHKTEREAMDFDLYNLRRSNIVVVNFNSPNSLGTAMELMLARELKKPVIGLNKDGHILHPWLVECTTRVCNDMRELVSHIVEYYLK